jgi:hypothetical protein
MGVEGAVSVASLVAAILFADPDFPIQFQSSFWLHHSVCRPWDYAALRLPLPTQDAGATG